MTHRSFILVISFLILGSGLAYAQEQAVESMLAIPEAKLGRDVVDRQIVDETSMFTLNNRVYLWMKVTGGKGDSLTVSWKTGDMVYDTKLYVGGSPWRTWAYKTAYSAGDWTVSVSDETGTVLKEMMFTVTEAMKE